LSAARRPNLIVVVADTFRRDHLGVYSKDEGGRRKAEGEAPKANLHPSSFILHPSRTPNLDRLAAESVVFDQAYACSFPTLPCRAELFTGKFVFPFLRWGPLPAGETTLAQRLGGARYHTAVIGDNLPFFRPGYGYDRGFQTRIHQKPSWTSTTGCASTCGTCPDGNGRRITSPRA
jgi:arylsulfatase A-like enzyme